MKKEIAIAEIVSIILGAIGTALLILVYVFGMTSLIDIMRVVLFGAFISFSYLFGCMRGYEEGYDEGYDIYLNFLHNLCK